MIDPEYVGEYALELNITEVGKHNITINGEKIYDTDNKWMGKYFPGTEITLFIEDEKGFWGWYDDNGMLLEKECQYSFQIRDNTNIVPKFE